MRINRNRLLRHLNELAEIGALPDGGVCRLAFSKEDLRGRNYVEAHLRRLGLQPRSDAIGNLWAVRPGTDPQSDPVLLGSHTDSVGDAGRFDGSLGVLAALEVLETLAEYGTRTRRPIGLISFVNEEGVRFMPDMMGSLYLRGDLDTEGVRRISGTDGSTIGENLDELRMAGPDDLRGQNVHAFLELHIEQGPILDNAGLRAGVVTAVQGLKWIKVHLKGRANHAGTTPMNSRCDTGLVAARIIEGVRELADRTPGLRATVGQCTFRPNLVNVIPEDVSMTLDLRHPDQKQLEEAHLAAQTMARAAGTSEGVSVSLAETASAPAVTFDADVVGAVRKALGSLGLPARELISGAGHDAQILAGKWPAGMIFVRSQDGVSHNPAEHTSNADVEAGANALLLAAVQLAA